MGTRKYLYLGGAAIAAGVVAGMAPATGVVGPESEGVWELGTVSSVPDGDTITANIGAAAPGVSTGYKRVRTIGVQAPEVAHTNALAQCGSAEATNALKAQLPVGANVQLRSVLNSSYDDYSDGRIVRSLYAQDSEGNWYDTSRSTVSNGWMMWFPLSDTSSKKPEWAHNLEYRVLADDAAAAARGLWSGPCGAAPSPQANLRMWVSYTQGTGDPERAFIENQGSTFVDLGGWTLRDSALNYHQFAWGTGLNPGNILEVQLTGGGPQVAAFPGVSASVTSTLTASFNNLPADNPRFVGDAAYLMDSAGAGVLGTGNLRNWFPYPCNPDACADALAGQVRISKVQLSAERRRPSTPGTPTVQASKDGSGIITVSWDAAKDLGAESVTYTVNAQSPNGGAALAEKSGITETSTTFVAELGSAYSFQVIAKNAVGESAPSARSGAVTPTGKPRTPGAPVLEARDGKVVVSWAPVVTGGSRISYQVSTQPTSAGCQVTAAWQPDTSCVVSGLTNGTPYSFQVQALSTDGNVGNSDVGPAASIAPAAYAGSGLQEQPGAPTAVQLRREDSAVQISWVRPASDGNAEITKYKATLSPGGKTCEALDGVTSCRIAEGVDNKVTYTAKVKAYNGLSYGPDSASSSAVIPFQAYDEGPDTGAPAPAAQPWIGGQFVDITNSSAAPVKLGGYGLWNSESAGGKADNPAMLFPANQTLAAGGTLRVRLGASARTVAGGNITDLWTEDWDPLFKPGAFIESTDYVSLSHLSRAQVDCYAVGGGTCRNVSQQSAPSQPVGITAQSTPNKVVVSWGSPISRGGVPIRGYTALAYSAPVGGDLLASCTAGGGSNSCSFAASIGIKYYVEVTASNDLGTSAGSWRVLAAPRTVPAAPHSVSVSAGDGALTVSWMGGAENGASITGYQARAYTAGTGGSPVGTCSVNAGTCTIGGLGKATTYYVDVVASNAAGTSAPSSPRVGAVTGGTPPPPPTAQGPVSTYSGGKVTVRWAAIPGASTYSAKLYTAAVGGKVVGSCSAKAPKVKCTTKKMKKRAKYYIELTATGSTIGSRTVSPRLVTGPAKKATAPTSVAATSAAKRVTISWRPPGFNGYSVLKNYQGRLYTKAKKGSIKAKCTVTASKLSCTTKKLTVGKTYYAAVTVKNSKGWSTTSTPRVGVKVVR